MKHIASCSFGEDSMAQIIVGMEHGEPIDEVVYSEVMFTPEISAEFPEHRKFIRDVAIPKLKELYGLPTVIVSSTKTMWDDFHTVRVRGVNAGKLRGFPIPGFCNINRDLKIPPIRSYLRDQGEIIQYVGIAADEEKRLKRLEGTNKVSLLAKYGVKKSETGNICERMGLRSPVYNFAKRNGCFFCPNASVGELRYLYHEHPGLWLMLHELQETINTSRRCFTVSKTIFDFEKQFREEDARQKGVNDGRKLQRSLLR